MQFDPRNLGLRSKILVATAVVTVVAGLALTWQSNLDIAAMATAELHDIGISIAEGFDAKAVLSLRAGNTAALAPMLASLRRNPVVLFAVVTDTKKRPIAHSFDDRLPQRIADGLFGPLDPKSGMMRGTFGEKDFFEVRLPLGEGMLGHVHVGLDPEYVSKVLRSATARAMFTLALVLALSLTLLALALDRLVRPIHRLSEVTRRIVEEGDLTQQVVVDSGDEIGVLAGHFSQMVERLRQIPLELNRNVQLLNSALEALEQSTSSQSSTVNRQATALQETQVTAEEIRQTSQVAARTAEGILSDIAKAESAGEKGSAALEQSLTSLADILDNVRSTAANIGELGERTRQIGSITNTVKDLADQSNMLALNAAIEAVRSGEHGKGFALVAREIRRLADQSIQGTERVREILESVRMAVTAAVGGSEEGARRVENSLDQMRSSAEHLRALANVVRENSGAVRQIATAVNQQNTGVNQVFAAVVDQSKMMEETVKQLDGTLRTVDTLKSVAQSLAEVLAKYKV
jgi:methyl-accepting chemotaxis protein